MNIVQAINSEKLFKPCFRDSKTWNAWFVLLKAVFGLPLNRNDLKLYRQCTGRNKPLQGVFRELWAVVGRRGGKSFIMSIIAVFLGLFHDFKKYLIAGERGVIQIIAADRAQARVIFRYISAILHSNPVFEQYIRNETKEVIELSTGVDIEVMTCSFRTIRGRTVVCAICDEIAFWRVDGANPDREILAAIRPSMATIPNSMLLVISSPYARSGVLYETHRDYFGKDDPDVLVWQAETRVMNPTIDKEFIEKERMKDPISSAAEWDARFRYDIESYIAREAVEACVVPCRYEITPIPGVRYSAFVDPSGGSRDSMTLAISHVEAKKKVLDCIREIRPPFNPDQVVEDFVDLLKRYGVRRVTGDRYGGVWLQERFRVHGISYEVAKKPKSDIYREFLPLLNSGEVELLDNSRLVAQIVGLERRTARGGRDSIDHSPNAHDDLANVCAGSLVEIAPRKRGGVWGREYQCRN